MTVYSLKTIDELEYAKRDLNFVVHKTSSFEFYKNIVKHASPQYNRWNQLVIRYFKNKSKQSYTNRDFIHNPIANYNSLLDVYFILIKDKFIRDPITIHDDGQRIEIQPGLKRSLFIPYLPNQEIIYFKFRKFGRTDDSIRFLSDNIVIETLWGENITTQVRPYDRQQGYENLVTQEDIEIYLKDDTVYFNDIEVFKKDHDWKICLPNLMEEK
jgi:hypothetical protein